jgi:CxxC motif-containing protein
MEKRDMVCIVCPIGCHLEIKEDYKSDTGYTVSGATCKRGEVYGVKELSNPTRLLTSTVKIKGGSLPRIPVRTDKEIPKDKIFDCMSIINKIELEAPVEMGQIVAGNIFGLDVNIIASRSMH